MRPFCIALILILGAAPVARAADDDEQTRRQRLDESLKKALEFLHKSQNKDGSWTGGPAYNPAITSLGVMAFLSAGHVPGEGPYGETVTKGITWVLDRQAENGLIATAGHQEMYHHGIATLMLAESAGMCDAKLGKRLKTAVEKAVEVILNAQRKDGVHKGGWRYTRVGVDGDISVTGWQIMALRAAKNLGCDVPAERISDAVDYIIRCRDVNSGGFNYFPNSRLTPACTGTSILALKLCLSKADHEKQKDNLYKAAEYLMKEENRPKWGGPHFSYSIYYASQAMFQLGVPEKAGREEDKKPKPVVDYWKTFRPMLHKELLTNQKPEGNWHGADASSSGYGENYCTAMAVLALTVEYRYLPIYQRGDDAAD